MENTADLGLALLVLIFLGFVVGKTARRDGDARSPDWVNMLAGYVTLPALAFNIVMEAGVAPESWLSFALAAMLAMYLTFLVMFVVSVAVGKSRLLVATMQGTAASFGHIGFLGIPLAHTLYGTEAALAVLVMLVSARMMHVLLLPVLVLLARPRSPARVLGQLMRTTLLDPLFLAIPAALAIELAGVNLPETIAIVLDFLAAAAVPMALFAVAISLARRRIGRFSWEIPVVTTVKLLVAPFITYCVLLVIGGFDTIWITAAVLASAMPTAARAEGIARGAGVYGQGMADCVSLSGMVGVASVTLLVWLIGMGALPLTTVDLLGR